MNAREALMTIVTESRKGDDMTYVLSRILRVVEAIDMGAITEVGPNPHE